jgi:L-galactose dehydrogenase
MRYRHLGDTSLKVSVLGFGASPLGDVFGTTDPSEGFRAVHLAIDEGINLFDVSPYYGLTLAEERLGMALAGRRNEVVLATKCGRYGESEFDFSAGRITKSLEESLRRLRTDYVDLFQAHSKSSKRLSRPCVACRNKAKPVISASRVIRCRY